MGWDSPGAGVASGMRCGPPDSIARDINMAAESSWGVHVGPGGKMETDQIILTEQVSILHPFLLVSAILRDREKKTKAEVERVRDRERPQPAGAVDRRLGHASGWRGSRKRARSLTRGHVLIILISALSPVLP